MNGETFYQETSETSAHRTELIAVIFAFTKLQDCLFNLYADSQYG
jgi:ribonuclease HI